MRPRMPLPVHASWATYSPTDALLLALILVAIAAVLFWTGTRIRAPIAVARPGPVVTGFLIAIWVLSVATFFIATYAYGIAMRETVPGSIGRSFSFRSS